MIERDVVASPGAKIDISSSQLQSPSADAHSCPSIEELIRQVRDLPTLPEVVIRVAEMVNNPHTSAKDLGKIIAHDQVQTARLLKLVNSAYYGFPQDITKVTTAIVVLGFNSIRQLLLSSAVFEMFENEKVEGFRRMDLLRHAVATAIASRTIGKHLAHPELEELFVAGLLHDIGKVVMDRYFHEEYATVIERAVEEGITFHTAERDLLEYDHTIVGQMLAKHWRLPDKLATMIANHHHPASAGRHGRDTAIVHLADILARAKQFGSGGDHVMPELDPWSWEILALDPAKLDPILTELEEQYPQVISMFDVEGDAPSDSVKK
jgi:putative nucleotidyltransferase with HDIG domain